MAHDCGQIIAPDLLRLTIEGNIVQSTSRALWEEVKFDDKNVTSVDWKTYPIVDMKEAPEAIDIILIDHPELPPTGAGEAVDAPDRRRARQRDLRRHRHPAAAGAVHAGTAEGGVGVRHAERGNHLRGAP